MGVLFRAWGRDRRVIMLQCIKHTTARFNEQRAAGRGVALLTLATAVSFLTILPGPSRAPSGEQIIASRAFYPAVGLLLGLLLVGMEETCRRVFPLHLTAGVLVVTLVVATRGLHLDGLMDVCDGVFGGYTRERRLEIMQDSHIGSFAVAGSLSILLLKYGAILSMLSLTESGKVWALLLFPCLSRWAMVLQLSAFAYARRQGLGAAFASGTRVLPTVTAGATALVASGVLGAGGGLILLATATGVAWAMGRVLSSLLGGLTGDVYGATNEVVEVVSLGTAVALIPHGLIIPLHEMARGW